MSFDQSTGVTFLNNKGISVRTSTFVLWNKLCESDYLNHMLNSKYHVLVMDIK